MERNYYIVRSRLLGGGTYSAEELASMTQSSIGEVRHTIDDLRRHGYRVRSDGRFYWIDGIVSMPARIDQVINQCFKRRR